MADIPSLSVVICCYNSASRLPETLRCIMRQQTAPGLTWEVVVVDNASTDNTADIARSTWERTDVALRVVAEPVPGLSHARLRGFQSARADLLAFVDDDNWLDDGWIDLALQTMREHPEVGICGGVNRAAFEGPEPAWFARHAASFAVGEQSGQAGDVTAKDCLYGAGMIIRRPAWDDLHRARFQLLNSGRKGTALSSGEDTEIQLGLCLLGRWRIWYEPRLTAQHCMTAGRMTWTYLRRLYRGLGRSGVVCELYEVEIEHRRRGHRADDHRMHLLWRFLTTLRALAPHLGSLVRGQFSPLEGSESMLLAEHRFGKLTALWDSRRDHAAWRRYVATFGHRKTIGRHSCRASPLSETTEHRG